MKKKGRSANTPTRIIDAMWKTGRDSGGKGEKERQEESVGSIDDVDLDDLEKRIARKQRGKRRAVTA